MPITKTASISPGGACSPSSPSYTWRSGFSNTIIGTSAALSISFPGVYTATVKCAASPSVCETQSSTYVACYQGQNITFAFTSYLNLTVTSPTGVLTNLNTVSGFSFPYANNRVGAAALKTDLNTWLAANNGVSAEVMSFSNGRGILSVQSSWQFNQIITNAGPAGLTISCTPASFSVSASNTSTGPPPVLGQATGTPTGCSSFVIYAWYDPAGENVALGNPADLPRGATYTLRAFCGDGQWASTTVLVT